MVVFSVESGGRPGKNAVIRCLVVTLLTLDLFLIGTVNDLFLGGFLVVCSVNCVIR
jgi:hypothetical protein